MTDPDTTQPRREGTVKLLARERSRANWAVLLTATVSQTVRIKSITGATDPATPRRSSNESLPPRSLSYQDTTVITSNSRR
jgi:hypothetical protein